MRTEATRPSGRPRLVRAGLEPSARALARTVELLAARHADEQDIVAVCEKWGPRLATLERQVQALDRARARRPASAAALS